MTDTELSAIRARADAATPGPWFSLWEDDPMFMNSYSVSTDENASPWDETVPKVIAGTLLQSRATICHESGKWGEDAAFIAHARTDIPALLEYIEKLKTVLPRALTWTSEPVCGAWNWWRLGTFDPPSCRYVFTDGTINTYRFGRILCKELGGEWCPIPMPQEPNP